MGLSLYLHKAFQVNHSTNQENDPLVDDAFEFVTWEKWSIVSPNLVFPSTFKLNLTLPFRNYCAPKIWQRRKRWEDGSLQRNSDRITYFSFYGSFIEAGRTRQDPGRTHVSITHCSSKPRLLKLVAPRDQQKLFIIVLIDRHITFLSTLLVTTAAIKIRYNYAEQKKKNPTI